MIYYFLIAKSSITLSSYITSLVNLSKNCQQQSFVERRALRQQTNNIPFVLKKTYAASSPTTPTYLTQKLLLRFHRSIQPAPFLLWHIRTGILTARRRTQHLFRPLRPRLHLLIGRARPGIRLFGYLALARLRLFRFRLAGMRLLYLFLFGYVRLVVL